MASVASVVEHNPEVCFKFFVFSALMVVAPTVCFAVAWQVFETTVDQAGVAAFVSVNVVMAAYVVMAVYEKPPKGTSTAKQPVVDNKKGQ